MPSMTRINPRNALRIASIVFLLLAASAAAAGAAADPLQYDLKFKPPATHLMEINIRANGLDGKSVDFAIPDWAPGSYYIENYWMNVQNFSATSSGGQPLAWRKTDEQTWRIDLNRATSVTISYEIYANTLANNCAQYNERHAFIGGPSTWMYLVTGKDRPITLTIDVPDGWKVATGMPRTDDSHFNAASYDWFADYPLEISDYKEQTFDFGGAKFHVIDHDIVGSADFTKFTSDVQKIVATLVPMMSPVAGTPQQQAPFDNYWFLFHIWPNSGGGLEHLNSTQINFQTDWDSDKPTAGIRGNQYQQKLSVTAHEFFHAWNVKRLRPKPLGPFDYTRQVHTPSLWISEGLTSYYGSLALVRAGLITPQEYLDGIAKLITKFEAEPGRKERSIEDTSWDTWFVRKAQLDTNLADTNYSYYDGGQVVGHLLDFAIRQNTNNQKSLDDWMRLMYFRYALPKPGFEPPDAIKAMTEIAGTDMMDFFHRYISGKDPLPYETFFAYAGIAVEKKTDADRPWVGTTTEKNDDGRAKISNILPGSPAETAGLSKNDIIIAVDNRVYDSDSIGEALATHKPGDTIRVLVDRLREVREMTVTLGSNPAVTYTLKPMEHPTDAQSRIYKGWLGLK
jgi:predicted metalloprotease with PDZ domain